MVQENQSQEKKEIHQTELVVRKDSRTIIFSILASFIPDFLDLGLGNLQTTFGFKKQTEYTCCNLDSL